MRCSTSRARRLALGSALVVLSLLGPGSLAAPAAQAIAQAEAGATAAERDTQSGPADGFGGYHGLAGPAAAAAARAPERAKREPLGPVGERTSSAPDVPGTVDETPPIAAATVPPDQVRGETAAALRAEVAEAGRLRVIVAMNTPVRPEATLSAAAVRAQRAEIDATLATLGATLAGTRSRVLTEFTVVPSAVATVDAAGLEALLADPRVVGLTVDRPAPAALDVSTGVVNSDALNAAGVLGNNFEGSTGGPFEVAVLDSGVDNQHDAFASRIVAQACFSATNFCPNGSNTQTGGASGDNCTYSTQCDHGTHVAGIAAGTSYADGGHEGVAGGARLVAVQVGHRSTSCNTGEPNPCWRYFFSDLDLALQHVLNLRNGGRNIVAVNMSLGGPLNTSEATCGTDFPPTQNLAANLAAAGVAPVAAAGNNGSTNSVSYPSCLPGVYAVAASDDSDTPAGFSNNSTATNWWAPGVSINAPVTTSATARGNKSGTSMASPHVAGAMALLRECVDGNGVPQGLAGAVDDLNNTGPVITHDGVSRRRLNVLAAATRNVNNNDFAAAETLPANPGAGFNDFDFNVCADSEAGEPGPYSIDNSVWWNWTPSATGTATISTEDGGGNVTTFDTTLVVYTGSTLAGLTAVAYDDDSGTGLRSQVVLPVNAGTTYRIKVDGFSAQNGLLNLHAELGPPPTCNGRPATLVGTTLADTLTGTTADDVIVAGDGNDTISALEGHDTVCGGAGGDTITTGTGDDFVLAGPGADVARGEAGIDTLVGNAGGGDNDDVGDRLIGGPDNDTLDGWVGDDVLTGGPDDDVLLGAAGSDQASYLPSATGVVVDLAAGIAGGEGADSLAGIERVLGSKLRDTLLGDGSANDLRGADGRDTVAGMGGNDNLIGGFGIDVVSFASATSGVTVDVLAGTASGQGNDTISLFENVIGSSFADTLRGDKRANELRGRGGRDVVRGNNGPDRLYGDSGPDALFGERGNDRHSGGPGNDSCNGGPGSDRQTGCETRTGIPRAAR